MSSVLQPEFYRPAHRRTSPVQDDALVPASQTEASGHVGGVELLYDVASVNAALSARGAASALASRSPAPSATGVSREPWPPAPCSTRR